MKIDLEMMELFDDLEDRISNAQTARFSQKSVIDKEELLAIIKEIRALMPDEVTQAVWINKERNRILNEAKRDAKELVAQAERDAEKIKEEYSALMPDEVTQAVWINKERNRILNEAKRDAKELVAQAERDAEKIKEEYSRSLEELKQNSEETLKDYIESSDVVGQAEQRAREISERAEHVAREIRQGSIEYATDVLSAVEHNLKSILEEVIRDKSELK